MSLRIKKDDKVVVIAGRSRGTTSRVLYVIPSKNRAVVEHVNMVKRHTKPRGQGKPGGIVEKEAPVHLSNLKRHAAAEEKASGAKAKKA